MTSLMSYEDVQSRDWHRILYRSESRNLRGKLERDEMAHVHGITTRASAGVEVEWLFLLVSVKDQVQISALYQLSLSQSEDLGKTVADRWEKNVPRRKSGDGRTPVTFSNLSKSS